jgi:hypothetical protein
MWVWVDVWVVKRWVEGRDHHAVGRDGVVGCDWEGLGSLVGNLRTRKVNAVI